MLVLKVCLNAIDILQNYNYYYLFFHMCHQFASHLQNITIIAVSHFTPSSSCLLLSAH